MSQAGSFATITTNSGAIITAPPASSVVTAAFGGLSDTTPKQNTLGYDIILNIEALSTNALGVQLLLGVGPTNPPTMNSVGSSFTGIGIFRNSYVAYVPANYWVEVSYSGILVSISYTVQAMGV